MNKKSLLGSIQETIKSVEQKKPNRFDAADEIIDNRAKNIELVTIKKAMQQTICKKKLVNLYENDSLIIDDILKKFMLMTKKTTESDILRMGLVALTKMDDEKLLGIYNSIHLGAK